MGDSWDETSFDVSEADAQSLAKRVDSEDLDDDLFGGLGQKSGANQSLLKAMQKSTGRGIFDDEEVKITPVAKKVDLGTKPLNQTMPRSATKPPNKDDDDLLADLLGDSDYSEVSQKKSALSKTQIDKPTPGSKTIMSTNSKSTSKQTPLVNKKPAPKNDILFDNDDDNDILGMLDTKKDSDIKSEINKRQQTPPRIEKSNSKFDDMINRTSFMKNNETPSGKTPDTPKDDLGISGGFTPSSGGRGRRGLNSGLQTPKSNSGLQPDDTFDLFMKDDENESYIPTPAKSSNAEDMFRVDQLKTPQSQSRAQTPVKTNPAARGGPQNLTSTPSKPANVEDMFRVDQLKSPPSVSRAQTPVSTPPVAPRAGGGASGVAAAAAASLQRDMRPHTHDGVPGPGQGDTPVQSRPPSAGRRAKTALPNRGGNTAPGTPQRRNSDAGDSLFADEDIPNKFLHPDGTAASLPWDKPESHPGTPPVKEDVLPWERQSVSGTPPVDNAVPDNAPSSTLPWENKPQPATAPAGGRTAGGNLTSPLPWDNKVPSTADPQLGSGVGGGTATQIILQQNTALEKRIAEMEAEKTQLQNKLSDSVNSHTATNGALEREVRELKSLVEDLEDKIKLKEREIESTQKQFQAAKSDVDQIEQRTERRYKEDMEIMEKSHKDQINRLNAILEEKEKIIQDEVKSASKRLKEKEETMLNENRSLLSKWERRVEETESQYEKKMREISAAHDSLVSDMKQKHEDELAQQRQIRKDELCAVLSVHQTTTALKDLTERVHLSAEEISNLSNKLDVNRSATLEEREKAAKVMGEYLHDLKHSLARQEKEITQERNRVQDLVGKMEKHLREQTRISNAAHDKLIEEEARFRTKQAAWEADKTEEEQRLERAKEIFEKSKATLLNERKEQLESFYKERKEIADEKSRIASVSQKATEKAAKGAVRQLDIEAQAKAMLDQAKREVTQIKAEKQNWDKDHKTRQVLVESVEKERKELAAERTRLSKLAEKLSDRSKETEKYTEALQQARSECVTVQHQLAKLETDIRMREDEIKIKERNLKEAATALAAEKELLKQDRESLNAEGIQCPACQKYRPRSRAKEPQVLRSSSPIRRDQELPSPIRRSVSPLSPLNLTFQSNSSLPGSRYSKYPSARVVELTGSLQRLNAVTDNDRHTLQMQQDKLSRFKEMDFKILSSSYS